MVTARHVLGVAVLALALFPVLVNATMVVLKVHRVRRGEPGNVSGLPLVGPACLAVAVLALHDVTAACWLGLVLLAVDLSATAALVAMHG